MDDQCGKFATIPKRLHQLDAFHDLTDSAMLLLLYAYLRTWPFGRFSLSHRSIARLGMDRDGDWQASIDELRAAGFILTYEVGGQYYAQIDRYDDDLPALTKRRRGKSPLPILSTACRQPVDRVDSGGVLSTPCRQVVDSPSTEKRGPKNDIFDNDIMALGYVDSLSTARRQPVDSLSPEDKIRYDKINKAGAGERTPARDTMYGSPEEGETPVLSPGDPGFRLGPKRAGETNIEWALRHSPRIRAKERKS